MDKFDNEENFSKENTAQGTSKDSATDKMINDALKRGQEQVKNIEKMSYVVHGAMVQCEFGSRPGRLIVPKSHGVYLRKKAQIIKTDSKPLVNVQSMGICSAGAQNPVEYEEEKKGKKSIFSLFFGKKKKKKKVSLEDLACQCIPQIAMDWQNTKEDVLIDGEEAITNKSFLVCMKGGVITICDDGQLDESYDIKEKSNDTINVDEDKNMAQNIVENDKNISNEEISDPNWIPDVMQLNGTTESEKYLSKRINNLNNRISDENLKWNQEKINQIWDTSKIIYDEYDIQIDPRLLLAIIFQEGTGSFNTSATNRAADGQHGVEKDFAKDLMKANNLVFGKMLGYAYYGDKFNQTVKNNNDKAGISGDGNFFQYANWYTPIIDLKRGKVRYGVYAGHGAWHKGVSTIYENLSYDGAASQYSDYLSSISKDTILKIADDINLPDINFTYDQSAQDHLGNPNGEYIIKVDD
ncbi:DUF4280 domain-containing protein [Defluviitalea phaphyphila]|uniref:DUF4280 domain-containing protein n=1 Tax=Defluviitalea phaphyphila TaxID=1473580 RepID=UPI000731D35E|nr:DUF4280 domain-containing protein [Defluviitalea phaphyphila]